MSRVTIDIYCMNNNMLTSCSKLKKRHVNDLKSFLAYCIIESKIFTLTSYGNREGKIVIQVTVSIFSFGYLPKKHILFHDGNNLPFYSSKITYRKITAI